MRRKSPQIPGIFGKPFLAYELTPTGPKEVPVSSEGGEKMKIEFVGLEELTPEEPTLPQKVFEEMFPEEPAKKEEVKMNEQTATKKETNKTKMNETAKKEEVKNMETNGTEVKVNKETKVEVKHMTIHEQGKQLNEMVHHGAEVPLWVLALCYRIQKSAFVSLEDACSAVVHSHLMKFQVVDGNYFLLGTPPPKDGQVKNVISGRNGKETEICAKVISSAVDLKDNSEEIMKEFDQIPGFFDYLVGLALWPYHMVCEGAHKAVEGGKSMVQETVKWAETTYPEPICHPIQDDETLYPEVKGETKKDWLSRKAKNAYRRAKRLARFAYRAARKTAAGVVLSAKWVWTKIGDTVKRIVNAMVDAAKWVWGKVSNFFSGLFGEKTPASA